MTGDDLRELRRKLGLNQQQMAIALKTPYGTYRGWETGRNDLPGVAELACRWIEHHGMEDCNNSRH